MNYETYLNDAERSALSKINKIVVWGFPLHTHTHSYIHAMWVKVFKEGFNKETHWFHDDDQNIPNDLDFNNCLFITEGYADKKIPILATSVYFVHNAINPERYLDKNARLIEIRFNVMEIHDINNDFKLDDGTHNIIQLSNETKYEKLTSNKDICKKTRGEMKSMNYECIYLYWATDLLPHEFDFDDAYFPKNNEIFYIGSRVNSVNYIQFANLCIENNIHWRIINPWETPVSFEDNKKLMKRSLLCPDFRPIGTAKDVEEFGEKNGKNHLAIGYLPCRVLKSISYGNIGITDSYHVKNILGEHVLYDTDMKTLFHMAMKERTNIDRIQEAMKHVQETHTYVHRARDLIRALLQ